MNKIFHLHKSDLNAFKHKMSKLRYNEPPKDLVKKKKAKRRQSNKSKRANH
jgi:hypothetical protein